MTRPNIHFVEEKVTFQTEIPVIINHINYGGHLSYDSVLTLAQEARIRWLKLANMSELKITEDVGYFVVSASISYKAEAFHNDILLIQLYVENFSKTSFELIYKIINKANGKTIALAYTEQVFINTRLRKPTRLPNNFKEFIQQQNSYV